MSQFTTIRLNAGNDSNGNPRRVFVTLKNGDIVATYDEGYAGRAAISNRHHRAAYNGLTFLTTPAEHRGLLKITFKNGE